MNAATLQADYDPFIGGVEAADLAAAGVVISRILGVDPSRLGVYLESLTPEQVADLEAQYADQARAAGVFALLAGSPAQQGLGSWLSRFMGSGGGNIIGTIASLIPGVGTVVGPALQIATQALWPGQQQRAALPAQPAPAQAAPAAPSSTPSAFYIAAAAVALLALSRR